MTPSQHHGVNTLMQQYGVDAQTLPAWLEQCHNLVLEIGFGMGEGLFHYASHFPESQFLGIEVHKPGVGKLLNDIDNAGLTNIKVSMLDANELIEKALPNHCLQRIQIFFPDPWPKKKHHKRRIIQVPFIETLKTKLKPNGLIHLATDWQDYCDHMVEVMNQCMVPADAEVAEKLKLQRPRTRFEARGIKLGHAIHDLVYALPR